MARAFRLATCLVFVALLSTPAFSAVLYWDSCIGGTTGRMTQGSTQGDGKWTGWSSSSDVWMFVKIASSVRYRSYPHNVSYCVLNSATGQNGWAEIQFTVGTIGYWTVAATQPTIGLNTEAIAVTTTDATGLPATTDAFSSGDRWNEIGTMKATSKTVKIKFTETHTDRAWYMDQIRLTSATPGAPTDGTIGISQARAGDELSWTAGDYSSSFDVLLDTNPDPIMKVASDLSADTTSLGLDSLSLQADTTYYWKVVAKNVDKSTSGTIWSFRTAAVPEPGSLIAIAVGLLGMIVRRRRA